MSTRTETRPSPWHEGEIALQRRVGVAERMAEVGRRTLRDHLIEQHRQFYPQLPFVVLGAVDRDGDVWATLRAGKPGFLHAPDPHRLRVAIPREPGDPAEGGLEDGEAVALLGIELHTRRRNRLNGAVRRDGVIGFDITVGQSFGNCPQYIQLRDFAFVRDPAMPAAEPPRRLEALDERARAIIAGADTFFVATYVDREQGPMDLGRQVDVSHRGGKPGFVRIDEDGVLTIPDFAGNRYFNTLGNILANPKAGLVFVDFETGDLLQLSGDAAIVLDSPEIAAFQGAERLWRVRPRHIIHRPNALPLRWRFEQEGWSPNSLLTGSWASAAQRLKAARLAESWRPFEIAKIVEESSVIRSFHLKPADGAGIVPHQAGQHLPIRVTPPGSETPAIRTYTLSVAPSDGLYRISVKREGLVSQHLHHSLRVGDIIEARAPAGGFTIDAAESRPAVLLAAGVGITPLLAMLRHIVYEGVRTRRIRPTWLFYAARSKQERAFDRELRALAEAAQGEVRLVRVLSDKSDAKPREDFESYGRIDMALLRASLLFDDYDFYLCGPAGFMQTIYDGLRALNIADARIHTEAFGPASLRRTRDAGVAEKPMRAVAKTPVPVSFLTSGKEARWTPEGGTLLELAEASGLAPPFSCRAGECGTCKTRILEGAVSYNAPPTAEVAEDEVLICCARPATAEDGGDERLKLDL